MTESSLVLHWDEPLEDGGSPIIGYTIERRTAMKKAWQKIGQTEGDVTQFECTNLKKGYTYFFRVFAVNVAGQGPPLQPDEAITAGKKLCEYHALGTAHVETLPHLISLLLARTLQNHTLIFNVTNCA